MKIETGVNVAAARVAVGLWRLLDDIDTLDDACRGDDAKFRELTYAIQRRRFELLSGEDFDAMSKEVGGEGAR